MTASRPDHPFLVAWRLANFRPDAAIWASQVAIPSQRTEEGRAFWFAVRALQAWPGQSMPPSRYRRLRAALLRVLPKKIAGMFYHRKDRVAIAFRDWQEGRVSVDLFAYLHQRGHRDLAIYVSDSEGIETEHAHERIGDGIGVVEGNGVGHSKCLPAAATEARS